MKITNKSIRVYRLSDGGATLLLYPWQTVEVPDRFLRDATFRTGLACGDLVDAVKAMKLAQDAPREVDELIPTEVDAGGSETNSDGLTAIPDEETEPETEKPKKTRKKKTAEEAE